jgi:hypothetical protein
MRAQRIVLELMRNQLSAADMKATSPFSYLFRLPNSPGQTEAQAKRFPLSSPLVYCRLITSIAPQWCELVGIAFPSTAKLLRAQTP